MRVLRELLVHGGRATLHLTLQEEVRQARDVRAVRPARVDARQPAPAESPGPSRVRLRGWKTAASATSPGPHGRTAASTGPSVAEWLVLGAQRSKTPRGSVPAGQGSELSHHQGGASLRASQRDPRRQSCTRFGCCFWFSVGIALACGGCSSVPRARPRLRSGGRWRCRSVRGPRDP